MQNKLKTIKLLTQLLDHKFSIFGFRFGLDPIIGLIPGGGDLISALLSVYLIYTAHQIGIPKNKLGQMGINVALDLILGSVPVAGDILDFVVKPNEKNLAIIQQHLKEQENNAIS